MKLVLENGEEFDLRQHVIRAAAAILERSPECHVSLERADRLAEQVLVAAAQAVARRQALQPGG